MIRIIFDNGETINCYNVEKVYITEEDIDKISKLYPMEKEENDVREGDRGIEESGTDD